MSSLSAQFRNPFIVCAVHPTGADSDRCLGFQLPTERPLDFQLLAESEELRTPEGTNY
ncbi:MULTISPECIES: hypothetical protein [Cyanophyceae]|uniref:hypothetical protein n=1 Tax=Cyanophyceae TaxID=3028117 RepID=UPI0016871A47|nr:hypothetical protein [Trichocoleus sp. FACHB-69]MBD1930363.1 hypothetical protein [Trichocoleus sp. FACHB-69]